MRWRTLILAAGLLPGGCAAPTAPAMHELAGHYESGFEVEAFHPCGSEEVWWVSRGEPLRERYREVAAAPYERLYVVVRGRAGPSGRYGHLAAYHRELEVEEVLEIRRPRADDCGGRT